MPSGEEDMDDEQEIYAEKIIITKRKKILSTKRVTVLKKNHLNEATAGRM